MSSAFSTPSPTLPLLPSSPPPLKFNSFSDRRPEKFDSLSIPRTNSWQELVSSAFPPTKSWQEFVSSCGGGGGGGGSQRQDSPLQSISNSPVSPLSSFFVPPSLGCPSPVSPPPPRKPSPFSTPTKSRKGLISSASSTPLSSPTTEGASANSPSCALCIECGGGSKRKGSPLLLSPSSGAKSNGGGSTPTSVAAKKRWMSVRNALKQMQHKWMMDNISQQLKVQNNQAPVIAINEKPTININNQVRFVFMLLSSSVLYPKFPTTVPFDQNAGVVQEVVHDENVSFDRDGDTVRVCYMCCCGRQKQIFFAITN
ncbi:hypothetical protein MKX03_018846 [Papaver bracteatum]|nr:hypothetical protein MKX03_018846 [Papaver bracteatum]